MENKTKKTLLQRHGIPIHHLDFQYIKDCKDGKEMEKIVHILRSNEEGYFPDLTKCAEEKLKELKPHSRLFRVEEQIKGREALEPNELKPIYDWNQDIKSTDKKLQKLAEEAKCQNLNDPQIPAIRKGGSILQNPNAKEKSKNSNASKKETSPTCERIKTTDYNKWDKYDAEEEILRLDLAEERQQEQIERKNRLNMQKIVKEPLTITEITEDEIKPLDKWLNLTDIEKEKISEEYRLRGNEYFRSKDYDLALKEYTSAIECSPEKAVAAYNNRALIYFKQQQFLDAIKDCEACLKLEPCNLKALLRLAEANYAYGRRRESYQLYLNVLKVYPDNLVALKATIELRKQFENLPPPNATRLQIQEESTKNTTKPLDLPKNEIKSKNKSINYDLADLIKPNRVVPNRLVRTAESLGKNMVKTENKNSDQASHNVEETNERKLLLPGNNPVKMVKRLIEEL